jgi:4-amino-4-deoxy-L-arabinose transferase-like glycosyltransferase
MEDSWSSIGPDSEIIAGAKLEGSLDAEGGRSHQPSLGRSGVLRNAMKALSSRLPFWWSNLFFPAQRPARASLGGWFWAGLMVLLLTAGPLLFLDLSYPLLEPDEGRYAEVAREMLTSGDWVVPTLNQKPFYDKPPLFYWLVAGSFRLLGTTESAARLVPALAAFLTVLATFIMLWRVVGARAAFLAALALTLMVGFIQCGRIVILDSLLTLFVTLALFTALEAVDARPLRRRWWLASSIFCALGVLTKGPIAIVLLAPPVAAYGWFNRKAARPTFTDWVVYLGLVLVLAAPWYVAIIARDPKFAYHFFVDQHLVRFFLREYHVQPVWYYLPVLVIACLPWSLLLFPASRFLFSRSADVRAFRTQSMGFFLLYAVWSVLLFSVSSSKLPPYILPALPAIAALVGCYLDYVLFQAGPLLQPIHPKALRVAAVVLTCVWLAMIIVTRFLELIAPIEARILAGLCIACMVGMCCWGWKLPPKAAWLCCAALGMVLIVESAHNVVPTWSRRRSPLAQSSADIAGLLRDGDVGVICIGAEWGSVPFYLGRDDIIVHCGERPLEDLPRFLSKHPRNLVIVRRKQELDDVRRTVPTSLTITDIADAGEIKIVLVEAARFSSRDPVQIAAKP